MQMICTLTTCKLKQGMPASYLSQHQTYGHGGMFGMHPQTCVRVLLPHRTVTNAWFWTAPTYLANRPFMTMPCWLMRSWVWVLVGVVVANFGKFFWPHAIALILVGRVGDSCLAFFVAGKANSRWQPKQNVWFFCSLYLDCGFNYTHILLYIYTHNILYNV